MNLLTLTTAEQGAGMALFRDEILVAHSYWASSLTHSQRIITMIQDMVIQKAGMTLDEIDGFVAAKGPGSFTGLRIGISVIKGLSLALSKPCAGVSSLDGIAWQFCLCDLPVAAMMDARKSQVYLAMYDFSKGFLVEKSPEMVLAPENAIESAKAFSKNRPFIVVGSGARAYAEKIENLCGDQAHFCPPSMDNISAPCLAQPVFQDPDFFHSPENTLTPSYIREGYY